MLSLPVYLALAQSVPAAFLIAKPAPDTVLARVGDVEIRVSALEPLVWDWSVNDALEEMISAQAILNEAKRVGVSVSEATVTEETQKGLKQLAETLPPGKTMRAALAEQGTTPSRAFLRMRNKLLLDAISLKTFSAEGFVKVSTIVIRPKNEQTPALSEAIKRADDAYLRLTQGAKWSDLLKENAKDEATLKSDGLLGWRSVSAFPETVQTDLKALKPGGYTKPAQTVNGFQIFRLEAHGTNASPDDLATIKTAYLDQVRGETYNRIRTSAKIEKKFQ